MLRFNQQQALGRGLQQAARDGQEAGLRFKLLDTGGSGEIGLEELVTGVAEARTAHFAALGIPEQPPKPFPPRPPPDTGEDDDVDDDSDLG